LCLVFVGVDYCVRTGTRRLSTSVQQSNGQTISTKKLWRNFIHQANVVDNNKQSKSNQTKAVTAQTQIKQETRQQMR